jgi:hypothetical protein
MADLICDTNVFYGIAAGRISVPRLREAGHRLLLTPVSVLELISHVTPQNLADRTGAAMAAMDAADELLDDPEVLLANAWRIPCEPVGIDWRDGLRALSQAESVEDLVAGVQDEAAGVVRRVDVPLARGWRGGHYDDFEQQMIAAVEDYVPGYAAARANAGFLHATAVQRASAEAVFSREEARGFLLVATRIRAALGAVGPVGGATDEDRAQALALLHPYLAAYHCYFMDVVTTRYAPQPNDFGDLECFIYLSGDRVIATSERRWLQIAEAAGLANRVLDPSTV